MTLREPTPAYINETGEEQIVLLGRLTTAEMVSDVRRGFGRALLAAAGAQLRFAYRLAHKFCEKRSYRKGQRGLD